MRPFLILLAATSLLAFTTPLQTLAQEKTKLVSDGPPGEAEKRAEKMQRVLGLTKAQMPKITALNKERRRKLRALRSLNGSAEQMRQRRERSKEITADYDKQLQAILTPAQFATYQKRKPKQKED